MARKLFLIIAIFLVIGQLVGQASADEGAMLSELSDMQDGPDDLAYELHSQVKRGARREKLKQGWEKAKPVLKKIGKGIGKAIEKGVEFAGRMADSFVAGMDKAGANK